MSFLKSKAMLSAFNPLVPLSLAFFGVEAASLLPLDNCKFLHRWSRRKLVMMVLMMTMMIKMKLMIMRTNIVVNEGDEVVVTGDDDSE